MAKVTLPYTIVNDVANDAVPVQGNLNALLEGINSIDTEQFNGAIVGLANLKSEVKLIESITHTPLTANYTFTITETTFMTQNITLSAQRYCLFLLSLQCNIGNNVGQYVRMYDGTTQILDFVGYSPATPITYFDCGKHAYKQLASGAHTIYVKAYGSVAGGTIYGDANGIKTTLTTIVFAF